MVSMKANVVFVVLTGLLFSFGVFAAAEVNAGLWAQYEAMPINERLAFFKAQKAESLTDEFLVKALLLADTESIEKGDDNQKQVKGELAQWLCRSLGDRKVASAAGLLVRIPVQYKDPFLRGEAWLALAKLGDSSLAAAMTSELNVLNAGSRRARPQEVLAAYIIQSLTILKAKAAFRAVAVASVAWYTPKSGVCELAKNALPALSTDPFAATLVLLGSDDDLIFRENFFNSLGLDKDPVAGGVAADAVLSTLVTFQLRDSQEKDAAVRLLKASLSAADKSPQPPATLSGPLKALIARKNDIALKLIAVRVLAKIADDPSTNVLTTALGDLNQKQKMGSITKEEVTLVRELIVNLGVTKKSMAQSVLQEVRFCNYTPAIVNLALESIAKLNS